MGQPEYTWGQAPNIKGKRIINNMLPYISPPDIVDGADLGHNLKEPPYANANRKPTDSGVSFVPNRDETKNGAQGSRKEGNAPQNNVDFLVDGTMGGCVEQVYDADPTHEAGVY